MPKLSQVDKTQTRTSVCIFGPPKSGKTELAGSLAEAGFNIIYVGLENGHETLFKLSPEAQDRVTLINIYDTKDSPNGIDTVTKLMTGAKQKLCVKHGKINCAACISAARADSSVAFEEFEFSTLNPATDIVVVDSFTQLTSSANAHATRQLDREKGQNEEFSHWRYQGTLLEKFLDLVQNNVFNVIVIAHEMGIDQEDGIEKIMPAGGTKNFARNVSKYFAHIIYCSVANRAHKAISSTTSSSKILAGSRTDVDISDNPKELIKHIFDGSYKPPVKEQPKPATKLGATTGTSRLLANRKP